MDAHRGMRLFVAWSLVATAGAQEAPPREWNQAQGNARHTCSVDVAPIKVPPQELWRAKVGELVADPIISQGKIYALARDGKDLRLVAVEASTGSVLVRAKLDPIGDPLGLAALDDLVVVAGSTKLLPCRLAAGHMRWERPLAGDFVGPPTVFAGGLLIEAGNGGVTVVELPAATVVGTLDAHGSPCLEPVAGVRGGDATALANVNRNGLLEAVVYRIDLGAAGSKVAYQSRFEVAPMEAPTQSLTTGILTRVARSAKTDCWYAWNRKRPEASVLREPDAALHLPLKFPPAIGANCLFGFRSNGPLACLDLNADALQRYDDGTTFPQGAVVAPPSIARDVVYLGNWAVEIGSRRVLWCRPELKAAGPAIPIGDERLVVATPDGQLVALTSGAVAGPPAKAGAAKAKGTPTSAPPSDSASLAAAPPPLPGSAPGVVFADGRFVAGRVTPLVEGRWRLETPGAAARDLEAAEIAVADGGDGAKLQGDEYPLFRACMAALRAQHVAALLAVEDKWKELKFYEEARRVVEEARRFGLPPARGDELLAAIAGRKSTTVGNADLQRKRCVEIEAAARARTSESVVTAAKWCAARGAPVAATAVRLHESDFVPGLTVGVEAIADWVPPAFPFNGSREQIAKSWAEWAEPLLPSGAHFFKADARLAKALARTMFTDAVMVRTDHVVFYSIELDPKIVGPCLSRAEATVRTLKALLGRSPSGARPDDWLNVFLYSTRKQYLDDTSSGTSPAPWSVGFYSPVQHLSRFYARQEGDLHDPLGRSLHSVMAHELTHHYCDRVWNPASTPAAAPGFWMEEGFAEFIADQQIEMDRLGGGLDDATVLSLDLAAAALRERQLLPFALLLDLDQARFVTDLEGGQFGPVEAKHTLGRMALDRRSVFYVESAALTWFVMNRFGAKGRNVYVDWYARFLRAQPRPDLWKDLGFAEMADFEKAFRDFLAGL